MLCHYCEKREASEANETFCGRCVDDLNAWDASDSDLLERLGKDEVKAWRECADLAQDRKTVEAIDRHCGCLHCEQRAQDRECEDCGLKALVIDCGHHQQPAQISADESGNSLCDGCAEAREKARSIAERLQAVLPDEGPSGLIARAEGQEVCLGDDGYSQNLSQELAEDLASMLEDHDASDELSSEFVWQWIVQQEAKEAEEEAAFKRLGEEFMRKGQN